MYDSLTHTSESEGHMLHTREQLSAQSSEAGSDCVRRHCISPDGEVCFGCVACGEWLAAAAGGVENTVQTLKKKEKKKFESEAICEEDWNKQAQLFLCYPILFKIQSTTQ